MSFLINLLETIDKAFILITSVWSDTLFWFWSYIQKFSIFSDPLITEFRIVFIVINAGKVEQTTELLFFFEFD